MACWPSCGVLSRAEFGPFIGPGALPGPGSAGLGWRAETASRHQVNKRTRERTPTACRKDTMSRRTDGSGYLRGLASASMPGAATRTSDFTLTMMEEWTVRVTADKDAGAVGVGSTLKTEVRERAVGLGKRRSNFLQHGCPGLSLALFRNTKHVSQQMPLLAADHVELTSAFVTQLRNGFSPVVLARPASYPSNPLERVNELTDRRSGNTQKPGNLAGRLTTTAAQQPENLNLGIRDRPTQGLFDGAILQDMVHRPRKHRHGFEQIVDSVGGDVVPRSHTVSPHA